MTELSKSKLNYIFLAITLSAFFLLRWSIGRLDPDNNAVNIGSLSLNQEQLCLAVNGNQYSKIEISHTLADLFSIIGKGSFNLGDSSISNTFTSFATFDPLGKLFGAKLHVDLGGRFFEIQLKGSENTEVKITIKNLNNEPIIRVFHLGGPLLFVDMENLNKNGTANFSFQSANLSLKGETISNLKSQFLKKIDINTQTKDVDCVIISLLDKDNLTKFNRIFDNISDQNFKFDDRTIMNLSRMFKNESDN